MSFVLLGILNAQAIYKYWLASLGGSSDDLFKNTSVSSTDVIYASGKTESQGQGARDSLVAKYDSLGSLQWQRILGTAGEEESYASGVDSSGNVYLAIFFVGSDRNVVLAKYNTSGSLEWQRELVGAGNDRFDFGLGVDSNDNVYVLGGTNDAGAGGYDVVLAKYNSSGTIQWQRVIGGSGQDYGREVTIDSSDNIYITALTRSVTANNVGLIAKYNSSGTIQWQRAIYGGGSRDFPLGLAHDSSGNIYAGLRTNSPSSGVVDDIVVVKYNSSGTIQWQRLLANSPAKESRVLSMTTDSNDNLYLTGFIRNQATNNRELFIAKYNSSGTIQFQRALKSVYEVDADGIDIDALDNLFVAGNLTDSLGDQNALLAKLPSDGSLTGTYELDGITLTYEAASLSESAASLTGVTSTLTTGTSTLTSSTSSLTGATSTLASELEKIG